MLGCLFERENLQLIRIFNIHHLIADIISRFYEIDQRMTGIFHSILTIGEANHPHFIGDTLEEVPFAIKESKLPLLTCH